MRKVIDLEINYKNFDGDLINLQREGKGRQILGSFGEYSANFVSNQPIGKIEFKTSVFPFIITTDLSQNVFTNEKISMCENAVMIDGSFGPNMNLLKGVIIINDKIQIHLVINRGKITEISLFDKSLKINHEEYRVKNNIFYPKMNLETSILKVNLDKGFLTYGKYLQNNAENGEFYEIDLFQGIYSIRNYEKGYLSGIQKFIDFSSEVVFLKVYNIWRKIQSEFEVRFADGRIIQQTDDKSMALMKAEGLNSYLIGNLSDDKLNGPGKLIVNGKTSFNCPIDSNNLIISDFPKFFEAIENYDVSEDPKKLNGNLEHDFGNGLQYKGFFSNDFVFCHKDAFSSCIQDTEKNKIYPILHFFKSIDKFEGTIAQMKPSGVCKVKYLNGDSYTGHLNECFMKVGKGQQLEKSGSLYLGTFKNNLYHGFGRIIDQEKTTIGFFEEGEIRFVLGDDDLNLFLLDDVEKIAESITGKMTTEDFKELMKKRVHEQIIKHPKKKQKKGISKNERKNDQDFEQLDDSNVEDQDFQQQNGQIVNEKGLKQGKSKKVNDKSYEKSKSPKINDKSYDKNGNLMQNNTKKSKNKEKLAIQNDDSSENESEDEDEVNVSSPLKKFDRKKYEEQGILLKKQSEQLVMVSIFHFKNGFAYHGKVVGNVILDQDEGDIITPNGERIKSKYKNMGDLQMGAFKSLDGKMFYMFSYDKRILSEVNLYGNK